jgi:hypothetical protein
MPCKSLRPVAHALLCVAALSGVPVTHVRQDLLGAPQLLASYCLPADTAMGWQQETLVVPP